MGEPATIAPGDQVSVLVSAAKFLGEDALRSAGPGTHALVWKGGTLGFASDEAAASFVVDEGAREGPVPGSLESFLAPRREGESQLERVRAAWSKLAAEPSDPCWVTFLAVLPHDAFDAQAAFELLERTKDLGIQPEIVRLFGAVGGDAPAAERLIAFLVRRPDPSLASLGAEALRRRRSE